MGVLAAYGRELARTVSDWEKKSDQIDSLIIKHSCIGGAAGLFPMPIVDNIIMLGNQMIMYRNINSVLGVSLAKNTLKVIGTFMLSQVAGMLAVFGIAIAGSILGNVLKASIVFAPAGMALNALINAAITYVLGIVYARALVKLVGSGKTPTAENLKEELKTQFADKDNLKKLYEEGKEKLKGTKFSDYKNDAEEAKKHAED
jgi:uncharacterized protein (DUF697 family)